MSSAVISARVRSGVGGGRAGGAGLQLENQVVDRPLAEVLDRVLRGLVPEGVAGRVHAHALGSVGERDPGLVGVEDVDRVSRMRVHRCLLAHGDVMELHPDAVVVEQHLHLRDDRGAILRDDGRGRRQSQAEHPALRRRVPSTKLQFAFGSPFGPSMLSRNGAR